MSSLANEKELIDWENFGKKLPENENLSYHIVFFCWWEDLESCLGKGGIDAEFQN